LAGTGQSDGVAHLASAGRRQPEKFADQEWRRAVLPLELSRVARGDLWRKRGVRLTRFLRSNSAVE